MRKESEHSTLDDGVWETTVSMVASPLNEKWSKIFPFLLNNIVAIAICHGLITQDDGKCCHGYYDMLHYTIGCIATAQ